MIVFLIMTSYMILCYYSFRILDSDPKTRHKGNLTPFGFFIMNPSIAILIHAIVLYVSIRNLFRKKS